MVGPYAGTAMSRRLVTVGRVTRPLYEPPSEPGPRDLLPAHGGT